MSAPTPNKQRALECPVCLEPYVEPKSLSCGHTVCGRCLDHLIRLAVDADLVCPVCRSETQLPDQGLPTNYAVVGYMAAEEAANHVCSACDRRLEADDICFCDGDECDGTMPICTRCAVKSHNGHRQVELSVAVERSQDRIDKWKLDVEARHQTLAAKIRGLTSGKDERKRQIEHTRSFLSRLKKSVKSIKSEARRRDTLINRCNQQLVAAETAVLDAFVVVEEINGMKMLTPDGDALLSKLAKMETMVDEQDDAVLQVAADRAVLCSRDRIINAFPDAAESDTKADNELGKSVTTLKREVALWQERHFNVVAENDKLQNEIFNLTSKLKKHSLKK